MDQRAKETETKSQINLKMLIALTILSLTSFAYSSNDTSFGAWDKIEIEEFQEYRYGVPIDFTWSNFLPVRTPQNISMDSIEDDFNAYISEIEDRFDIKSKGNENLIGNLKDTFKASRREMILSAADFLCIFQGEYLFFCQWKHFQLLYEKVPVLFPDGIDQVRVAYIFAACYFHEFYSAKGRIEFNKEICPNPCKRNPCARHKGNTYSDECEIYDTSMIRYVTNYKCMCKEQYEWHQDKSQCVLKNICRLNEYCGGFERSIKCIVAHRTVDETLVGFEDYEVICQCTREYMGSKCQYDRNACIANFQPELPNGNLACGINGRCEPVIKTNEYFCVCDDGFINDRDTPYADCNKQVDPCTKTPCYHGYCKMSNNRKMAVCVCDDGYTGSDCDVLAPQWLSWREWSACDPTCGIYRKRHRNRTCSDLKMPNICYEQGYLAGVEYQTCSLRLCKRVGNFTEWTKWSECDSKCGSKLKSRTRRCQYPNKEDMLDPLMKVDCIGKTVELKECKVHFYCDFINPIIISAISSLILYSIAAIAIKLYLVLIKKRATKLLAEVKFILKKLKRNAK